MGAAGDRLDLTVDILDMSNQQARALRELKPSEFIQAILEEFRELEYLGENPRDYQLVKAEDQALLQDDTALGEQLTEKERHLLLRETQLEKLPQGTAAPAQPTYLREQNTNQVFRLNWMAAIIGRASADTPNELLAADLKRFPTGMRVSRRHVRISQVNGEFFVESMASNNPIKLQRASTGETIMLEEKKVPLAHQDIIKLERSDISLKFIIRSGALPNAEANGKE